MYRLRQRCNFSFRHEVLIEKRKIYSRQYKFYIKCVLTDCTACQYAEKPNSALLLIAISILDL